MGVRTAHRSAEDGSCSSRRCRGKQPGPPEHQHRRSEKSAVLKVDSAFSGLICLVGFGLGKRKKLFLQERSCAQAAMVPPSLPHPHRG